MTAVCALFSFAATGCTFQRADEEPIGREAAELASQYPLSIQNVWSGLCMDVPYGQAFTGQNVNEWPCHGGASQQFVVESLSAAGNFRIRFQNTNYCVVPQGQSVPSIGYAPQNFWLVLADCSTEFYSGWLEVNSHTVNYAWGSAQEMSFRRYDDPGYCLDAPGHVAGPPPSSFGASDPGWNNYPLQAYDPCHYGGTQTFDIRAR
jgi:hypothetical protein